MNLNRYIQGIRKGSEINRLERKAMEDPILADALEGYDKVRKTGHEIRIKRMQHRIFAQTNPANSTLYHWGIVACLIAIVGIVGGYFLWYSFDEPETVSVTSSIPKPANVAAETTEKITDLSTAQEMQTEENIPEINTPQPEAKKIDNKEETGKNTDKLPARDAGTNPSRVINSTEKETATENTENKKPAVPEPVIGIGAYNEYLRNNMIRPVDEEGNVARGSVSLSFRVDNNGYPYDIRITKSLTPLADWEAMRLVKEGPLWTAGESATINVNF